MKTKNVLGDFFKAFLLFAFKLVLMVIWVGIKIISVVSERIVKGIERYITIK